MSTLSQRAASVALGQRPSPNDGHGKLGRDEMHRHSPLTTVRFEREIIEKPWQTRVRSQQQQRTDTVQKVDPRFIRNDPYTENPFSPFSVETTEKGKLPAVCCAGKRCH